MEISPDRHHLRVSFDDTLDAASLGDLIELLAELRAQMQPPVPRVWSAGEAVAMLQDEPQIKVGQSADNTVLLALRHPGIGWCAFTLTLMHAAALRDALARRTAGVVSPLENLGDLGLEPGEAH